MTPALHPFIMVMIDWADRWFRAPEGPVMLFTHQTCGRACRPVPFCSSCRRDLSRLQIQIGCAPPQMAETFRPDEGANTGGVNSSGAARPTPAWRYRCMPSRVAGRRRVTTITTK